MDRELAKWSFALFMVGLVILEFYLFWWIQ